MPTCQGYPQTPGIHTAEQIAGWKRVTDAVHEAGGHIFLQLWPVGRISHSSYHGETPVAPSAVAAADDHFTASRSEEHTSELQSLMRISYAVFCLNKNTTIKD